MLDVDVVKRRGAFTLRVTETWPMPGVVAILGRSGCGKSTLVNVIAGLMPPDAGRVSFNDDVWHDSYSGRSVPAQRRGIGYVFQDARLFPHLRVAANLNYASVRARGVPYVTLDEVVDLLDLAPLMSRRTHQLSGGERQRVALGRALLSQPRLLLLDEPLASLDAVRRVEVLPYLETLRDRLQIPMIYVAHNVEEVLRLATHLVVMDAGSVLARGGVAEMSLDPHLRSLIGPDEVGAIVDGAVLDTDPHTRLTRVAVGDGELYLQAVKLPAGTALRVQVLARDVIVSTRPPSHLSVRNNLPGVVAAVDPDGDESDLISIDVGRARILARITKAATHELGLRPGLPAWALVKSVSLRGRAFSATI